MEIHAILCQRPEDLGIHMESWNQSSTYEREDCPHLYVFNINNFVDEMSQALHFYN